jgi:hypothetical protein
LPSIRKGRLAYAAVSGVLFDILFALLFFGYIPRYLHLAHNFHTFMLYFLKSRKLWEGNMAQGKSFDRGKEFAGLDFHSLRLEERFIRTMETLIQQPDKSIREASEDRVEAPH